MRRTNTGAARHMALTRPGGAGGAEDQPARRSLPEPDLSPRAPLSRITVLPVSVGHPVSDRRMVESDGAALVRIIEGVSARSVSPRVLEASGADVVLLDA